MILCKVLDATNMGQGSNHVNPASLLKTSAALAVRSKPRWKTATSSVNTVFGGCSMTDLHIDLRALPAGIRKFVEVLGAEKAIAVLTEQQGQMFYIPKHPCETNEFCKVFGVEMAKALSRYAEQQYQIPMLDKVLMQVRDQEIVAEVAAGTPIQALVKRFKITRQRITKILHDHGVYNEKQMDLWG
jgi:hypothetical protein